MRELMYNNESKEKKVERVALFVAAIRTKMSEQNKNILLLNELVGETSENIIKERMIDMERVEDQSQKLKSIENVLDDLISFGLDALYRVSESEGKSFMDDYYMSWLDQISAVAKTEENNGLVEKLFTVGNRHFTSINNQSKFTSEWKKSVTSHTKQPQSLQVTL